MLKGSGQLELRVVRDGPRRVLQILDIVQSRTGTSVDSGCTFVESADCRHFLASTNPRQFSTKFSLDLDMPKGLGISVIAAPTNNGLEELLYFHATGVSAKYHIHGNTEKLLNLSVDYIQADNQIEGAFPRVILQKNKRPDETNSLKPCITAQIMALPSASDQNRLFRYFKIETSSISVSLDEGLILRCLLLKDNLMDKNLEAAENFTSDPQMNFLTELRKNSKTSREKYYFEEVAIMFDEIHASLYKQSELPPDIKLFKGSFFSSAYSENHKNQEKILCIYWLTTSIQL